MLSTEIPRAGIASCAAVLAILWLGGALAQAEELHQEPTSVPQDAAPSDEGSPPVPVPSTERKSATSPAPKSAEAKQAEKKTESAAKKAKKEEHEPANPDTGASTLSGETLGLLPNPYEQQGIKFTLSYIADPLSNVSGGFRQGTVYEGRLNAAIDVDFAKSVGLRGMSFHKFMGRRCRAISSATSCPSAASRHRPRSVYTRPGWSRNSGTTSFQSVQVSSRPTLSS